MDNGTWFFGLVGMLGIPIVLGLLLGALIGLFLTVVALNLALTKLVGFTLDSLRARLRTRADHRALRDSGSDPRPAE